MAYNKVYENKPIWHNDREPAINETRLNALSGAVDIIDDRVIELDEKPLNDMSNVDITNLQNGQGIKWNATTQKWENGIVGGSPIMTWAEYQEKWEAGEIEPLTVVTISDLSDAFVNLVALTWAEYQHLIEQELDDDNILYAITDRSAGLDLINDNVISEVQSWSSSKINSKLSTINNKLDAKAEKIMGLLGASKSIQLSGNKSHILVVTDVVRNKYAMYFITSAYGMIKAVKVVSTLETELSITTVYHADIPSVYTVSDSDSGTVNKVYFVLG